MATDVAALGTCAGDAHAAGARVELAHAAEWPEYVAVKVARFAPRSLPTCLCASRGWQQACGRAEVRPEACSVGLKVLARAVASASVSRAPLYHYSS